MSFTHGLPYKDSAHIPNSSFHNRIDRFLATPRYIIAVMLLTLLCNTLSLELPVYTLFTAVAVYTLVWGADVLPLMPIFLCAYIAPSVSNNPGRSETSVFFGGSGIYLGCLGAAIAVAFFYRIVRDRKQFFKKRKLLPSMLILATAYILGGLGSEAYAAVAPRHLLFALAQSGALLIPYFLFCGGIDWKQIPKDYFAWVGFCLGGVLFGEILWIYLTAGVVVDGVIYRDNIFTGWGIHNNLGGMLALMIPFAFYLATKYHKGWLGTVIGSVFLVGVVLSCSRNSILIGFAIYLTCVILMLYYARNRRGNTIAIIAFIGTVTLILTVFLNPILHLFSDLLSIGLDPNYRDVTYAEGMKLFRENPVFGVSFFSTGFEPWEWSTNPNVTDILPPRWHNTIVQILASCGTVGILAYLLHRVQTVLLFLVNHNKEKTFIGCSVAVLLLTSLFDCHFFNIGPTLFYSMALAFAENYPGKQT